MLNSTGTERNTSRLAPRNSYTRTATPTTTPRLKQENRRLVRSWVGHRFKTSGRLADGRERTRRQVSTRYRRSHGDFYNQLLDNGHVNAKLLGNVFDSCPTLVDKVNFLNAVLLQPPTDQQREWIEAFGLAWRWTDIVANARDVSDVAKAVYEGSTIADRSVN
jgi:hypothetical protein